MDASSKSLDGARMEVARRLSDLARLWQNAGLADDDALERTGLCIQSVDQLEIECDALSSCAAADQVEADGEIDESIQAAAVLAVDVSGYCHEARAILHRVAHEISSRRPSPDDEEREDYPPGGWLWEDDTPGELSTIASRLITSRTPSAGSGATESTVPVTHRSTRWFSEHTKDRLNSCRLAKARERERLSDCIRQGHWWFYCIDEVCRVFPDDAPAVRRAADRDFAGNLVGQGRTPSDKSGQVI